MFIDIHSYIHAVSITVDDDAIFSNDFYVNFVLFSFSLRDQRIIHIYISVQHRHIHTHAALTILVECSIQSLILYSSKPKSVIL